MQNVHRLLIAAVLAAALGGIIYFSATHKEDPHTALTKAFSMVIEPRDMETTFDLSITADELDNNALSFNLHGEGVSNNARSMKDLQTDLLINVDAQPTEDLDFSFKMGLRIIEGVFYVKMSEFSGLPDMPKEIQLITNLWFSIDPIDLAEKFGDEDAVEAMEKLFGEGKESREKEQAEKIAELYKKYPFIINPAYSGGGMVGETKVRTITFSVDKTKFTDFITDLHADSSEEMGETTGLEIDTENFREEFTELMNETTFSELSAQVGVSDGRLRGFSMKLHVDSATDDSSGDVIFSMTFEDTKEPVSVKKPDSFLPVDDILGASLGAARKKADAAKVYLANDKEVLFVSCLASRGTKMYGTFWCPHCEAEIEKLKLAREELVKMEMYVECSTPDGRGQTKICKEKGITGYPTWEFADGSRLQGGQSLETIAGRSGCTLL